MIMSDTLCQTPVVNVLRLFTSEIMQHISKLIIPLISPIDVYDIEPSLNSLLISFVKAQLLLRFIILCLPQL